MGVFLRPQIPADLPSLTGGESPYDDFGPRAAHTSPRPPELDAPGALSVVVTEDRSLAGTVSWIWQHWGPNAASRNPMIGIWLRPSHRGRGIGRDAQAQLVDLFFRHTTVNRVEAHTDVDNIAEQRALEAAGFQHEGVTRGAQWRDGSFHDGVLYAILRADPRPAVITPAQS
ncbi:GNAT family N-acetyltransferase [Allobranchiibius sp. GilTou73]|uniref:GNAT family N-acetyltransferase n=1 Tax=Allobranchiibius sp. GilTou73 TaxID=2904523 RepID=UPI001F288CC9|nr:GNAT family protein [Allobranchiibius sp. GilTou73]UIJ35746.1 GNAT family N-acetyltransferase [Allobranchiibius sp. GilTou73]